MEHRDAAHIALLCELHGSEPHDTRPFLQDLIALRDRDLRDARQVLDPGEGIALIPFGQAARVEEIAGRIGGQQDRVDRLRMPVTSGDRGPATERQLLPVLVSPRL